MEIGLLLVAGVVAGAVLGALGVWLWHRGRAERLEELKGVEKQLATERALVATLEERVRRIPELEQELAGYQAAREENARLLQALNLERRQSDEKLKLLAEAKETLAEQFQNLANRIFEEKGEKLVQQNVANLDSLLKPLGERLREFQVRVEETYDKESKQRFSLQSEIQKLVEANARMSVDALNLANALKGDSRTQGAWGEVVLERCSRPRGCSAGGSTTCRRASRPPRVARCGPTSSSGCPRTSTWWWTPRCPLRPTRPTPGRRTKLVRKRELGRHIDSLRAHVKGLAEKNYQSLYGIRTPDFVLMFVPVEPAFALALRERQELFEDAFNRNVMIVSPTTLLISLRTIASIWRYEYQNRNAQELVRPVHRALRQVRRLRRRPRGHRPAPESGAVELRRRLRQARERQRQPHPPGGAHPRARLEAVQAASRPPHRACRRRRVRDSPFGLDAGRRQAGENRLHFRERA
jgi:DNA recombination protein RmuC